MLHIPQELDRHGNLGRESEMEVNKGREGQSEKRQEETLTPIKKGDRVEKERK